ncbi:MAG: hypothetical protein NTX50_17895, partial [Candidatus Sumerlaeota bacterium]|nr:hypothetical protein [Candidatus Sumerlaeota bacterium]
NDVMRDVDLIEEIARVHGYNAIPESTPYLPAIPFVEPPERRARHELRRMMQAADFWEVINYSFVGRDLLEKCGAPTANVVELVKPLTADQAIMRPSLLPSLIQNAHTNQRHERGSLRLFEIGKIYEKIARQDGQAPAAASDSDADKPEGPYHEEYRWGLIMTGTQGADRWRNKTAEEMDFFHVKGVLEMALKGLGIQNLTTVETTAAWLHPGRAAELRDGGEPIVVFGELHPEIVRAMELRGRIMVAEARMEAIERKVRPQKAMAPLARFPKVDRDIALVAPRSTPSASLEAAIRQTGGDLLEEVRLFDRYEGERIEPDKVSLAYSMSFRAPDRTLREEEVDEVVRGIVSRLESEFSATLRTE